MEKYVLAAKKNLAEIKPADFELKEVKAGETYGKKTEIISGLDSNENTAIAFN